MHELLRRDFVRVLVVVVASLSMPISGHSAEDQLAKIDNELTGAEQFVDFLEGMVHHCEQIIKMVPDYSSQRADDDFVRESLNKDHLKKTITDAERLASAAEKLKELINPAQQAVAKICSEPQRAAITEGSRIDTLRAVMRGIYEALRKQIEITIAELQKNRRAKEAASALRGNLRFCESLPKLLADRKSKKKIYQVQLIMGMLKMKSTLQELEREIEYATRTTGIESSPQVLVLGARLKQLQRRWAEVPSGMESCGEELESIQNFCKSDTLKDQVERADKLISELNGLEARRAESIERLAGVLSSIESDYAASRDEVARAKQCIESAGGVSCDPKSSKCPKSETGGPTGSGSTAEPETTADSSTPRDTEIGDSDGPVCKLFRYAMRLPGSNIAPTTGSGCGQPCPVIPGWYLPVGTICANSTNAPVTPGQTVCPPGQHWSKDLGRCHANN